MATIWNGINTIILLLVLFALLTVIAMLATGARGGPLDPPGPPVATLPQVEPRSPIPPVGWNGLFPIDISQPGSYFLTRNLDAIGAPTAVSITASYVTLDLNGFAVDGQGAVANGIISSGQVGVTVQNGTVRRFSERGVSDSDGIITNGKGARYRNLRLENNAVGAILGEGSVLEDCVVRGGAFGVSSGGGGAVRNCSFSGVTGFAITALGNNNLVEGNHILVPADALGISVGDRSTVRDNVIMGETSTYASIDLSISENSVVVRNRFECGKGVGTSADDVFPFDFNVDQTNICTNP